MAEASTRNMGKTVGASGPMRFALWIGGLWLALLVGAGLHLGASNTVEDDVQRRFDGIAQGARQRVDGAVQAYAQVLRNLGALYNANGGEVSRLQFHRYVESLGVREHYPAIESLNYGAHVLDAQRDAFVAAVRADRSLDPRGYPAFDIYPPGRRPSYEVLTYLEPMMAPRLGIDMVADRPVVARRTEEARDRAELIASARPMTVATPRRTLAMTLRLPVYRGGAVPDSVEGRRAAYIGSVGIGFSMPTMVQRALDGMGRHPVALQLYLAPDDEPAAGPVRPVTPADTLLYDSAGGEAPDPQAQPGSREVIETVLPVSFHGMLWKARFVASRSDMVDGFGTWFPRLSFAAGFGATLRAVPQAVLAAAGGGRAARPARPGAGQRRCLRLHEGPRPALPLRERENGGPRGPAGRADDRPARYRGLPGSARRCGLGAGPPGDRDRPGPLGAERNDAARRQRAPAVEREGAGARRRRSGGAAVRVDRRHRAASAEGQGRRRQPCQDRVPVEYEPRDPHADEQHHRHELPGAEAGARAKADRLSAEDSALGPTPARHHQPHTRLFQDRSRPY
jgi:hypothetical protein